MNSFVLRGVCNIYNLSCNRSLTFYFYFFFFIFPLFFLTKLSVSSTFSLHETPIQTELRSPCPWISFFFQFYGKFLKPTTQIIYSVPVFNVDRLVVR